MIFCWHHYRYEFLKSVKISKNIISQICITNKIKNFGKRVSLKYLIDDFAGLNFFASDFRYMPLYRSYSFPNSKWFLAMRVRRFANALFSHFKTMFSLIFLR